MLQKSKVWLDSKPLWLQGFIIIGFIFIVRTFGFGLYQVPTCSMETTMLIGERFFSDKLTVWFTPLQRGEIVAFNGPMDASTGNPYPYSNNYLVNLWQRYVWGPINWTKRVIGIPGDHIVGTIEDGKTVVYLNGEKLDEPYLNKYPLVEARAQERITPFSFDPNIPWDQWSKQPFYGQALQLDQLILNDPKYPVLEPGTPMYYDIFDVTLGENQYWVMGDNRLGSWDSRGWGPLDGKLIHGRIRFCMFSIDSLTGWWIYDLLVHPIDFWSKVRWSRCLVFVK